ncbi:hypothetical protein K788_0008625 [Paraburkholderia caribensis MBA4]|uniref:Uncharacterized protein n=1 Tax=Paraburkholderia caribensis MBA4 TaxID=1323664 RepID=A0A0P0R5Z8_9BURK|nr:hypothetical protein K788_0008625 [Paraburkholderia caribensis MBA4]
MGTRGGIPNSRAAGTEVFFAARVGFVSGVLDFALASEDGVFLLRKLFGFF